MAGGIAPPARPRSPIPLARSRQSSVGGIRATSTSVECLRVCCEPDSRRKSRDGTTSRSFSSKQCRSLSAATP
jgi:hypothetical protein